MIVRSDTPALRPATVSDVRSAVLDAVATDTPLRIIGADTWQDAGPPVESSRTLSLRDLSGIIAYVPGDLTITVFAGTSLAELAHATAAHGQWLGLDATGDRLGTIGATIATASVGPLAHAFGTPRDLILGVEAVTGYGDVVRPGGRVVKNVAGFDLVRLYTGSWGTLGPITSLTLRLRALPVHDVTLAMTVPDASRLPALLEGLRQSTLSLLACEWVDGDTALRLGVSSGSDALLIRLGGNDSFIRGQRAALERLSACTPVDAGVWSALADLDNGATAVVRFSGSIRELPGRIARLRPSFGATGTTVSMHASVSRGVVRVRVTNDPDSARIVLQTDAAGETRIPERLPAAWWATEPDPFRVGLAGRIRAAFDPQLLCNRRVAGDA